jgi:type IV pilus assembly protein PilE
MSSFAPREAGFTLIEMMIVLVIIAVLMMVALPAYESQQIRAKRSVAQVELLRILARQEQFFLNNRSYSTTLAPLGFADPWIVDADGNEIDATASNRIYSISLASASATAFEIQAVPQARQVKDTVCATMKVTSTGVKSVTGGGTVADCW